MLLLLNASKQLIGRDCALGHIYVDPIFGRPLEYGTARVYILDRSSVGAAELSLSYLLPCFGSYRNELLCRRTRRWRFCYIHCSCKPAGQALLLKPCHLYISIQYITGGPLWYEIYTLVISDRYCWWLLEGMYACTNTCVSFLRQEPNIIS